MAGRKPGGDTRTGHREDPGLHRPGRHRFLPLVQRLPGNRVDAAAGNATALAQLIAELKTTYGVASTQVETRTITATGNTATVRIEMEPNSVWLVVLTAI
jgi:hypothetical protein